jgi:uncharacterized protein
MKPLSWDEVESAAEELANRIKESKFDPDCLIGVTTGGLFPLALLATRIKGKSIFTVTAKKVKDGDKETVTIANVPSFDLSGKAVLLIDEIAQSGETLNKMADAIKKECGVGILKTAALAANSDVCEFWPDYYVLEEEGDWIVFPWENGDEFAPYKLKNQSKVSSCRFPPLASGNETV